jgi:hypothetical protein
MMTDQRFRDYMKWVSDGIVFFVRPHVSLVKADGVRAGVSWESVLRIDGMIKLMLEMHGVKYLPIDSEAMQERVRTIEFVLDRAGARPHEARPRAQTTPPVGNRLQQGAEFRVETWPEALITGRRDHEA